MEKLDTKQREIIKKMSTVRLVAKLVQAGVKEEDLEALSREQLLEAWAELVATGKDVAKVTGPVTTAATATAASSVEFERERLQFEREKFQAEMAARERDEARLLAAQEQDAARLA